MKEVEALVKENPQSLLFEDDLAYVVFTENPITLGHLRIFPKQKVSFLEELPSETSQHLFLIASKCATLLFEGLKCHGTNIVVKDGANAQMEYDRVCVEAIARYENDGLDMFWEPKPGDQKAIVAIGKSIKDNIIIGASKKVETIPKDTQPETKKESENDFWNEQLHRIP